MHLILIIVLSWVFLFEKNNFSFFRSDYKYLLLICLFTILTYLVRLIYIYFAKRTIENKTFNSYLGSTGQGRKIRHFSIQEYNEKLAQGYVKEIVTPGNTYVQVIDTYGISTHEEYETLTSKGYKYVGYPFPFVKKEVNYD